MTPIRTRISVAADGTLSGRTPELPPGEHEAEIVLAAPVKPSCERDFHRLMQRVRVVQEAFARLPVLDPRSPEEIVGYNQSGHFD